MSRAPERHRLGRPAAPQPQPLRDGTPGHAVPTGPGDRLDGPTRATMERLFDHDFSAVRVHSGKETGRAARAMGADGFASGLDIGFAAGRYDPSSGLGRALIAHELAHVVQQCGSGAGPPGRASPEVEADAAAEAVGRGSPVPPLSRTPVQVQRRVVLRDVGRGEHSGFARRDELVTRLNDLRCGLIFALEADGTLTSAVDPANPLNEFGRQMQGFTDPATALIPLRLTNRHGRDAGRIEGDVWASAYVDIDDLLASTDLGLQWILVHFLRERQVTPNYANRIGSPSLDDRQPGPAAELRRRHGEGIEAERLLFADFFGDPTIRLVNDFQAGPFVRAYRNSRGDLIRTRSTPGRGREGAGIDAFSVDVRLRDGTVLSAEAYRDLLERERGAAERRRLLELRGGPLGPAP
ncbi:MAG TPA: DUF4157 domain-containing protein [Sphingomicrobium sp.]